MSEKEFLGVSNASSNIRQVHIKEANCNEIRSLNYIKIGIMFILLKVMIFLRVRFNGMSCK